MEIQFLLKHGLDINSVNETTTSFNGYCPLHIAIRHNNISLFMRFLAWGADPEKKDKYSQEDIHQKP